MSREQLIIETLDFNERMANIAKSNGTWFSDPSPSSYYEPRVNRSSLFEEEAKRRIEREERELREKRSREFNDHVQRQNQWLITTLLL